MAPNYGAFKTFSLSSQILDKAAEDACQEEKF